jgi:hypothetical protein
MTYKVMKKEKHQTTISGASFHHRDFCVGLLVVVVVELHEKDETMQK